MCRGIGVREVARAGGPALERDEEVELHQSKPAEWTPRSENDMTTRSVQNLTAFVPAKDFALSSRFYRDPGFAEIASIDKALRFERDGYGFWLQDYYVDD